ncbi:MAG TPA: MFS transporter [Candidatus Methylomirabilis sp.]|nr:MFS transporter [Candidatus Methylomirabilis sp.]
MREGGADERTTGHRAFFYGWVVVAGAFISFAISAGLMHSYAVFLVAFLGEFGWSRAETSVAYSVSQLVGGVSSPLIGALVDRLGPRLLVLAGASVLAVGLAASAYISSLWQVVVLYGLVMTLGANCLGLVVSVPIISRWFARRRGLAISIVQSANGFGRATSAPLVQLLISALGWRRSYLALAGVMAVSVFPIVRFFPRREPSAADRRADERSPSTAPPAASGPPVAAPPSPHDWTLSEAVKTPHFWLLFSVYLLTGLGSFLVSLHQLAFAVDMGFDKLYAASVLGTGSLLAVVGTVVTGTISDYIGREISAIMAYGISIIGVICALFITSSEQGWLLWLHACFFGLTWGARGPAITAKTADLFQGSHLGAILGVISIGTGLGSAVGSWASGLIFDLSGSYRLAFELSITSYIGGCVAFWLLRRPTRVAG